jgi:hypothetical protein
MTPTELATRWREDAETFDRYGDEQLAKVCRTHADDLEAALRSADDDALDLASAARESGLSIDRLRHKVAAGELPNAGRKGKPLIRRGDLPVKRQAGSSAFDAAGVARSLLRGPANG